MLENADGQLKGELVIEFLEKIKRARTLCYNILSKPRKEMRMYGFVHVLTALKIAHGRCSFTENGVAAVLLGGSAATQVTCSDLIIVCHSPVHIWETQTQGQCPGHSVALIT